MSSVPQISMLKIFILGRVIYFRLFPGSVFFMLTSIRFTLNTLYIFYVITKQICISKNHLTLQSFDFERTR
jgi:hypothetical protein